MQAPGPPGSAEQQLWGRAQPWAPHRPPGLPMTLGSLGELRRAAKPRNVGGKLPCLRAARGLIPAGLRTGAGLPPTPRVSPPSCAARSSGPGSAL